MFNSVAGVDVHKEKITITVLKKNHENTIEKIIWESSTFTEDLEITGKKILDLGVKHVAMESTGVYWKPIFNVWDKLGLVITLGNATHIKNVPGRKTDVKDSEWIATLHLNGLIRPSYIPEAEFRELRLLTRHRMSLIDDLARVKNRIQKLLEDGNLKLGSVISDIFGVAGTRIIESIASGEDDPDYLASLVTTNVKKTREVIRKSLVHTLQEVHKKILQNLLLEMKYLKQLCLDIEDEISTRLKPHEEIINQLCTIPGINQKLAEDILAETSINMSTFKDDKNFAAWAGVAPGNHESASKKKKTKCRHGNPILKKCLIQAANGAVKKKYSFFQAKADKLTLQTGSRNKAKVAIANKISRVIFKMLNDKNCKYKDPGPIKAVNPQKKIMNLVNKLKKLGVEINYHTEEKIECKSKITTVV